MSLRLLMYGPEKLWCEIREIEVQTLVRRAQIQAPSLSPGPDFMTAVVAC